MEETTTFLRKDPLNSNSVGFPRQNMIKPWKTNVNKNKINVGINKLKCVFFYVFLYMLLMKI